jgi:hypothetical protein
VNLPTADFHHDPAAASVSTGAGATTGVAASDGAATGELAAVGGSTGGATVGGVFFLKKLNIFRSAKGGLKTR